MSNKDIKISKYNLHYINEVKQYFFFLRKASKEKTVRVICYEDWADLVPGRVSDILQLTDILESWHVEEDSSPIVVQCRSVEDFMNDEEDKRLFNCSSKKDSEKRKARWSFNVLDFPNKW